MTSPVPPFDQTELRSQIPILTSTTVLNACSHAPQAVSVGHAIQRYSENWNRVGMDWDGWLAAVEGARLGFARLIGAQPDEIAIVASVSEAASIVASALNWNKRSRIAVLDVEFPALGHVWQAQQSRGAEVSWIATRDGVVDPQLVEAVCNRSCKLLSASHGYYLNGQLQNLEQLASIAHDSGAYIFVDAYQSAGVVPIDVHKSQIDFLAAGALKYLMGGPGVAFLYVRGDQVGRLEPTVTGWFGRSNPFEFDARKLDWSATARRFELGTPAILPAIIAQTGLEIINSLGVAAIRSWQETVGRRLLDGGRERGLSVAGPMDMTWKTGSTAFTVDDAPVIEGRLRDRGVLVSARGPVVRLAPHYFTTLSEIDRALDLLTDSISSHG